MQGLAGLSHSVDTATDRVFYKKIRYWTCRPPSLGWLCKQHTGGLHPLSTDDWSHQVASAGVLLVAGASSTSRVRRLYRIVPRTCRTVACKRTSGTAWPRLELFGSVGGIWPQLGACSRRVYVLFKYELERPSQVGCPVRPPFQPGNEYRTYHLESLRDSQRNA